MALAYPEGECFFVRTALDGPPNSGAYMASDEYQFYSHMMIEYIWNVEADHGQSAANFPDGYTHPRSDYKFVIGSTWGTIYGNWEYLPFSYGPSEGEITKRVRHPLCTSPNHFIAHENGASAEMLGYIRSIYIPIAYSADKDHPELCSFIQISFALDRTVSIWRGDDKFLDHKTDKTLSTGVAHDFTLGLDVTGLIALLTIPRQLRKDNCYNLKLIKITHRDTIGGRNLGFHETYNSDLDKNWTDVIDGNYGLEVQWKPPTKTSWFEDFIKNVLNVAIGFIPVAGPFLQIAFSVGWSLIVDSDSDEAFQILKDLCPGIDLTDHIVNTLKNDIAESRRYLPDNWKQLNLTIQSQPVPDVKTNVKPLAMMDRPMLSQWKMFPVDNTRLSVGKEKGEQDRTLGDYQPPAA